MLTNMAAATNHVDISEASRPVNSVRQKTELLVRVKAILKISVSVSTRTENRRACHGVFSDSGDISIGRPKVPACYFFFSRSCALLPASLLAYFVARMTSVASADLLSLSAS